jgi:hypothetical protein
VSRGDRLGAVCTDSHGPMARIPTFFAQSHYGGHWNYFCF